MELSANVNYNLDVSKGFNELYLASRLSVAEQKAQYKAAKLYLKNRNTIIEAQLAKIEDEAKAKELKKSLDEKYKLIDEDNLVEPDKQTFELAWNNFINYAQGKEITNAFANLIASTTDATKINFIHPSFSSILSQINSNDLKNLSLINNKYGVLPACEFVVHRDYLGSSDEYNFYMPMIACGIDGSSAFVYETDLMILETKGLIKVSKMIWSDFDYDVFYSTKAYQTLKEMFLIPDDKFYRIEMTKKTVVLTGLGESFIKCCVE